ncbi:MAG: hypothetical protein H7235_02215 [Bdellovibrionaceae bacterium]|nr:hypothetical protein [Pseudobdellovibrionaceae bacterium]
MQKILLLLSFIFLICTNQSYARGGGVGDGGGDGDFIYQLDSLKALLDSGEISSLLYKFPKAGTLKSIQDLVPKGPHDQFLVTTSGGCQFWFQSATQGDGAIGDFVVKVLKVKCQR